MYGSFDVVVQDAERAWKYNRRIMINLINIRKKYESEICIY